MKQWTPKVKKDWPRILIAGFSIMTGIVGIMIFWGYYEGRKLATQGTAVTKVKDVPCGTLL